MEESMIRRGAMLLTLEVLNENFQNWNIDDSLL